MVKKHVSRRETGRRVKHVAVGSRKTPTPQGPKRILTEAWSQAVKDELEARGKDQTWLAEQLGVKKGVVSKTLNLKQHTSPHVDRICEILEIAGPEFTDRIEAKVVSVLRRLRTEWPEEWEVLVAKVWSSESRLTTRERK